MKEIEVEFQSNANGMGVMIFRRITRGTNTAGKPIYIYSRQYPANPAPSTWEVFIPSVKRAGTYPLPNGKSITYTEDFEEYPGASKFGFSAWDCTSLSHAKMVYDRLMAIGEIVEASEEDEKETVAEVPAPDSAPKHRGRPRVDRPALTIPAMDFSTNELAAANSVDYPVAALFVKEALEKKEIHFVRKEQRAARGKPTTIFASGPA